MKSSGFSQDFHPGDLDSTMEMKHRHTPRHMNFRVPTRGADPRTTRIATAGVLFILVALFACLAMWLSTLGAFTGGTMVVPGRLF